jgi:aminoglycoside phosphotransferase (APT) family kinase protein
MIRVSDALVSAACLAREGTRVARERLRGSGLPRGLSEITPAWLTSALQSQFPGARVAVFERLEHDAGTTERARIAIVYDRVGPANPPASVFVKTAPLGLKTRLFVNLMQLGTAEAHFYREIAGDVPVRVPHAFHAADARPSGAFVLVLEDLVVPGARFSNVAARVTLAEARAVMRALARLHAAFWESPRFHTGLEWLKSHERNRNMALERFVCAAAMRPALRRFHSIVPAELHAAAPLVLERRDRLEQAWSAGPLTLIHGDAHVGNMFFLDSQAAAVANEQEPAVGFLDWQVVQRGQGMRDVTYFLANSVTSELRRAHERDLLASYVAALAEHRDAGSAAPFAFDEAWRQYRLHALYAWIAAVVTAAAATFQAEPIVRAGLARAAAAVLDLDSLGALRALGR